MIQSFNVSRYFALVVKFYPYNPPSKFVQHYIAAVLDNVIARS